MPRKGLRRALSEFPPPTIASKHPRPTSQTVIKRLKYELMDLMMNTDYGISAFPEDDDIFLWRGTISGIKDTVFEGTQQKLSVSFSDDYPFKPPNVKFLTPCFHPNVDIFGNLCLDIFEEQWSAIYNIRTILISVQALLGEPNTSSPLNRQAAELWLHDKQAYRKRLINGY